MDLHELQKEAYYDILMAFHAESSSISSERIMILHDLMKEWKVPPKAHTFIEGRIKADPLITTLRDIDREILALESIHLLASASDEKEKQKVIPEEREQLPLELLREKDILTPANLPEEKSESSTPPSWGQVSPESLVDKHILIRLPGEDIYTSFYIKAYDAQTETHRLISFLSRRDYNDPCDWVDLRHIPAEDTQWISGHPGFPTPKCYLKPGETILHTTSTTGDKRPLKKGNSSLTQILNKPSDKGNEQHTKLGMDKGKSIA